MLNSYHVMKAGCAMLLAALLMTGCGGKQAQPQDTKAPVTQAAIGLVDINRAIQAHPRYSQYQALQNEISTLESQLQAAALTEAAGNRLPDGSADGMNVRMEQEFNARMAQKQAEYKEKLDAQADVLRKAMAGQLEQFTAGVDQESRLPIFNLQLKLKTVQLTTEQATALQKELEILQQKREESIAAREQALSADLNKAMNAATAQAGAELDAYAKQLHAELDGKAAGMQTQLSGRSLPSGLQGPIGENEQTVAVKKQELADLEQTILSDIRGKVAQAAIDRGLTAVLVKVAVNVQAVDVTDVVIAGFKK